VLSRLADLLRCLRCGGVVGVDERFAVPGYPELGDDGRMRCEGCGELYPLVAGTPRMLDRTSLADLRAEYPRARQAFADNPGAQANIKALADTDTERAIKRRTAASFAYEWDRFGETRAEWRKNFLDYLRPHEASALRGRRVLDVGTGSGRHAVEAVGVGADVVAVDLGRSIDVARRNLPSGALTVQADAERLPFAESSFDFVMSIGVLHHLPDPERALRAIVPFTRGGGHVHIYLYWIPERSGQRRMLRAVTAVRRLTVHMDHRLLHILCYPVAASLLIGFVLPHRLGRRRPRMRRVTDALPLKIYADYPFAVLVNDQFDRFSAPLERRYTRDEVNGMLVRAGLEDIQVLPNAGWVADGRRPALRDPQHTP